MVARHDQRNNDLIVKLAEDFNKAQPDYKVVPSQKAATPTP